MKNLIFNETFADPSWPPHHFTDLVCFGSRHLVIVIVINIAIDIVIMILMTLAIRYAVYQLELLPAGVHASFHTLATTFLIRSAIKMIMKTMAKIKVRSPKDFKIGS